jgi:hypothetical protein
MPKCGEGDLIDQYAFVTIGPPKDKLDEINLTGKVWNIICKIDELQFRLVDRYNQRREELIKKMNELQKKHKEFKNNEFIAQKKIEKCPPEEKDGKQDKFTKNLYLFLEMQAEFEKLPFLSSPEEFFNFYKNSDQFTKKQKKDIKKDLGRSDPGNPDWKIDHKTGNNYLYNILKACCMLYPQISYC